MPRDTAGLAGDFDLPLGTDPQNTDRDAIVHVTCPRLDSAEHIGAALRAIREFHRLDLEDLSESTRIRKSYLSAIEEMRLGDLPSRPFIIGYVRAYARALQCDPEAAAARFRRDAPEEDQTLRAPVGVRRQGDPRLPLFIAAGLVVVVAVALWNIAQHSIAINAPARGVPVEIAQSAAKSAELPPAVVTRGPVPLGAPLPAPPESTTPEPYVTPGLETVTSGNAAQSADNVETPAAQDPTAAPTPFVAKGAVYGAPAAQSTVIVQASRPGSLVIHGADGAVYFAKELAVGEAYRVPQIDGLIVDVSDPLAFNYFVGGTLKGALPAAQEPVSKLTEPPSAP